MNFPPVLFYNQDFSYLFTNNYNNYNSSSLIPYQTLCKKLLKFENKDPNFQSSVINWVKSLNIQQLIKYFSFKSQWFVDILHEMILISDSRQDLKYKFISGREKNPKFTSYINFLYSEKECPRFSDYFNICDDEGLISLSRSKSPEEILKKKFIDNIRYITLPSHSQNNIINLGNNSNNSINKKNEKILYEYNNVVTLSYEYLSNIEKLLQTFSEISKKACFKYPIEIETQQCKNGNKNYYNFKIPKWLEEQFSLAELLCAYFEQSILINYQYFLLYKQEISYLYYEQFDELLENMYKFKEFITNSKDNVEIIQSAKPEEIKKLFNENQYIKKIVLEKKAIDDDIKNSFIGKMSYSKKHTIKTIINNTLLDLEKLFLNDKSNFILYITFIKDSKIYTTEDFVTKIFYDIINNYWKSKAAEDLLLDDKPNPNNSDNNKKRKKKKKKKKEEKNDDKLNETEENKDNNNFENKDLEIENNNNEDNLINKKEDNLNNNLENDIEQSLQNENENNIININNDKSNSNEEKKENENTNNNILNVNHEINKNLNKLIEEKKEIVENIILEKDIRKEQNITEDKPENLIENNNNNKNNKEYEIENNNKKEEDEDEQKNEEVIEEENMIENNHKKKKEKNFFLYPTFKDKKKKNKQNKKKEKEQNCNNNTYNINTNTNSIKEEEPGQKEKKEILNEDKIAADTNDIKKDEDNKNEITTDNKISNRKNSNDDNNKEKYKKSINGFDYKSSKQKNKFNIGMKLKNIIKDNSNLIIPKNFQPHDNSYNKLKYKNQSLSFQTQKEEILENSNSSIEPSSNNNFLVGSNLPHFTSFNFRSNKKGRNYRNKHNNNISPYNFISDKIIEFSNEIRDNTIKVNTNKGILGKAREKYIKKIYEIVNIFLINEKIEFLCSFYGSSVSGLSIENSDIDIMVKLKENKDEKDYVHKIMNILVENFKKNNINYITNIIPIFSASVPVIKLECNLCNDESFSNDINNLMKKCDLSYNDVTKLFFDITFFVVENEKIKIPSELMIDYIKESTMIYPQIIDIIYIMKRFLFNRKLNKSYQGGISSYSLFLLTLAFIKSFKNKYELPIGSLLIEYLNYYTNFDFYNTAIYPNNKDENIYIIIEDNHFLQKYNLNIIDPITGLNVSKSTFKMDQIQKALREVLDILITNLYNINNDNGNNNKRLLDSFLLK